MIVVIQCAARKRPHAGRFQTSSGQPVMFVADPSAAPAADCIYARPDDASDQGPSWRELVLRYNARPEKNPFGLLPAFDLYKNENETYRRLAQKFGLENTYILSAGWGLINATFLTPYYDITFTPQVRKKAPWKHRNRKDRYQDLCMLPAETTEPIFFFGGNDYAPLFASLTKSIIAPKTVFHYSPSPPAVPGCAFRKFPSGNQRKWMYECADAFIASI